MPLLAFIGPVGIGPHTEVVEEEEALTRGGQTGVEIVQNPERLDVVDVALVGGALVPAVDVALVGGALVPAVQTASTLNSAVVLVSEAADALAGAV